MAPKEMLAQLQLLADRAGLVVRYDTFDLRVLEGRGGLCWIGGKPLVLMDACMPVVDKVAVLAEALSRFDLEVMYVPPALRRRRPRR